MAWYKPTAYGTHQELKENARHIRHAQEEEAMQHEIEADNDDRWRELWFGKDDA